MELLKKYRVPVFFLVGFVIYTILVRTIDVKTIGPQGSWVGFSGVNGLFSRLIGYHPVLYTITEFLGIIALLPVVLFGVVGLLQLIQRKSLLAVDKDILVLGGIYIGVLLCYILFNKVAINYRPVILDEGLEASYPSSHTMLAVCVLSTAYKEFQWRLKRSSFKNTLLKTCRVLMVLIVLGRLFSGVHWLTDIIGGLILSGFFVTLFKALTMDCKWSRKK